MKIYTKKSSSEKKQALMIAYNFTVDELSSALSFPLYQVCGPINCPVLFTKAA